MSEIKGVFFVRDFEGNPDRAERKIFRSRPRLAGLWVRMTFKDTEVLEAILPNNLLEIDPLGYLVTPPDVYSNNLRIFIPRTALTEMEVLGVITDGVVRRMSQRAAQAARLATRPSNSLGSLAQQVPPKRNRSSSGRPARTGDYRRRSAGCRSHLRGVSICRNGGLHGGQFHPLVDGVKDQFQTVGNSHLIVNRAEVVLHGLLGNGKVGADFPVSPALHQVADDGLLPVGQGIDGAGWVGGTRLQSFAMAATCRLGIHVSPSVTRRAHLTNSCGSTVLRITPAAPLRTWRIEASSDEVEAVATTLH